MADDHDIKGELTAEDYQRLIVAFDKVNDALLAPLMLDGVASTDDVDKALFEMGYRGQEVSLSVRVAVQGLLERNFRKRAENPPEPEAPKQDFPDLSTIAEAFVATGAVITPSTLAELVSPNGTPLDAMAAAQAAKPVSEVLPKSPGAGKGGPYNSPTLKA